MDSDQTRTDVTGVLYGLGWMLDRLVTLADREDAMSELDPLKQRSAELLLQLYEARREPTLRAAREWFVNEFHPESAREAFAMWVGERSAPYRMVTTYWEMAASFVTLGAIDAEMFHAANTEYVAVFAKVEPYLAELRTMAALPRYLEHLERVVRSLPDAEVRLTALRKYMARRAAGHRGAA